MKSVIALLFLFVAVNALDQKFIKEFNEKLQKLGEECAKDVGASTEDITQLLAHKIPSTHNGKCMIFCFYKHFHIQNEDGSVDKKGAMDSLEPLKEADASLYEKVAEVFTVCGSNAKTESDPCETAAGLAKCGIEEAKARGLNELMFE